MRFDRTIFTSVLFICLMGAHASANDRQLCLEDTLRGDLDPVHAACSRLLDGNFVKLDLQAKYHWRKAEILYRQHKFKKALEAVELSLVLDPVFPAALRRRAMALSHLGRGNEAFVAAGKLIATAPEWSGSHLTLASLGVFHLTFDQRMKALARAVELDPKNYLARLSFGSFLIARGRIKEGETQWQVVLEADREVVDAQYHYMRGRDEFELYGYMLEVRGGYHLYNNRYDEAHADFTRLIKLHPEKARGYSLRARQYMYTKQFELAEADVAKALELLPNYSMALGLRVWLRYEQKNYQQAIEDADVLLAGETRERANIHRFRGFAHRKLDNFKQAFENFLAAAKLDPTYATDAKLRMTDRGYYPETADGSVEDIKFTNGLMACAIDPKC